MTASKDERSSLTIDRIKVTSSLKESSMALLHYKYRWQLNRGKQLPIVLHHLGSAIVHRDDEEIPPSDSTNVQLYSVRTVQFPKTYHQAFSNVLSSCKIFYASFAFVGVLHLRNSLIRTERKSVRKQSYIVQIWHSQQLTGLWAQTEHVTQFIAILKVTMTFTSFFSLFSERTTSFTNPWSNIVASPSTNAWH